MPAATIAICSGVAGDVVLADRRLARSAAAFGSSGKRLVATPGSSSEAARRRSRTSRPASRSASAPSLRPRPPKAVLQEIRSASVRVALLPSPPQAPAVVVGRSAVVSGRSSSRRRRSRRSPGCTCRTRERRGGGDQLEGRARRVELADRAVDRGLSGSALSFFRGGLLLDRGRPAVGVVCGWLTIARIAPVVGSSATTAPLAVAQRVVGGLLRGRVEGQHDAAALLWHLAGDHVDDAAVEAACRTGAGQHAVLAPSTPPRPYVKE